MHKASLKEILPEDVLGARMLEESDRLVIIKTTIFFKKETYNNVPKQLAMSLHLGQYWRCLCGVFYEHDQAHQHGIIFYKLEH